GGEVRGVDAPGSRANGKRVARGILLSTVTRGFEWRFGGGAVGGGEIAIVWLWLGAGGGAGVQFRPCAAERRGIDERLALRAAQRSSRGAARVFVFGAGPRGGSGNGVQPGAGD